jgi:hypothetical protein
MKLHVVYDGKGKIVAAVRLDADHPTKHPNFGQLRPVVKPGHHSADLDVPEEHAHLTFADVCRKLKVETVQSSPRFTMSEK